MKKLLTDSKTGKQMTILYDSKYLPAFGEDGIQYFILSNLTDWSGKPRNDCTIVDMENKIAIKPEKHPAFGIRVPMKFIYDKEAFEKATSISEYAGLLREKGLLEE